MTDGRTCGVGTTLAPPAVNQLPSLLTYVVKYLTSQLTRRVPTDVTRRVEVCVCITSVSGDKPHRLLMVFQPSHKYFHLQGKYVWEGKETLINTRHWESSVFE